MSEIDNKQNSPCPSFDELSAWHDGELIDSAELDAHLSHCQQCQTLLREFEEYDACVSQHLLEMEPDDAAVERLVKRTTKTIRKQQGGVFTLAVFCRVAACCALAFVCVYLIRAGNRVDQRLEANQMAVANPLAEQLDEAPEEDMTPFQRKLIQDLLAEFGEEQEPVLPASSLALEELPLPSTLDAAKALAARDGEVDGDGVLHLSNISLVGYGSPRGESTSAIASNVSAVTVSNRVRHVWLVENAADPLRQLKRMMPEHKQDFDELIRQKRDEYVLQFVITDGDLQGLVDHFDGVGFTLLSPQAPQPGHRGDLRLSGKTIQYEIDVVEK